jgi:hypothetical protein
MYGRQKKCVKFVERKKPLEKTKSRPRSKKNIEIYREEIWFEGVEYINVVKDTVKYQTPVDTVSNIHCMTYVPAT